jgi:uncharacterized delta-60 repeat protein
MKRLLAMGVVLALVLAAAAWAAGGRDKGFGKDGFTLLNDPGGRFELLTDLTVLPGGKILAVGARDNSDGYLVARFKANGRPDRSFDGDGFNVQPYNGGALEPRKLNAMEVDSRGRIVAAGLGSGPAGFDAFGLARYRPNGLPDPSFGDGGISILSPDDFGSALAVDTGPGNKVVAVGGAGQLNLLNSAITIVRVTGRGRLDTTFGLGGSGVRFVDFAGSGNSEADAVKVLANGSIVIAGSSESGAFIGRLDSSGEPVTGFGSDGFTVKDIGVRPNPTGSAFDIAADRRGRFVMVGDFSTAAINQDRALFAARFRANGRLDRSFADGGIFRLDRTRRDDSGFAVAVQPDGRIVIAGVAGGGGNAGDTLLVRLTARGRLDRTFGRRGQVVAGAAPGFDEALGVALQRDGGILVAGDASPSPTESRLMVARFRGDPPCFGRAATITGTPGRDTLNGTPGPDVITALGGPDTVNGRGGRDLLCGGAGRDRLRGGNAGDRVDGGAGHDSCIGGAARDSLRRCE